MDLTFALAGLSVGALFGMTGVRSGPAMLLPTGGVIQLVRDRYSLGHHATERRFVWHLRELIP